MSKNIESGQSNYPEQNEQEPRWRLTKRLVISGHPGTGKTYVIGELAKQYGLNVKQVIKIGDLFREFGKEQTGQDPTGYIDREPDFDRRADALQIELLTNPNPGVFIIESKLGGLLTWQKRQERTAEHKEMPPIFTILLLVSSDVGNQRVFARDSKKNNTLTFEESTKQTQERKTRDLELWKTLYPILILPEINPLTKEAQVIYDHTVDTTKLTKEEVVTAIHRILVQKGVVERITQNLEDNKIPPSEQIFPNPEL